MATDKYKNKVNGFYLIGFFDKGLIEKFLIEKQKPFETDENGVSFGKCFPSYPQNYFPKEWVFIETDVKIKDIHKDKSLKEDLEDIWKDWCKKYKRKYISIFEEEKEENQN